MGSCASQNVIVNPDMFILDGCYVIPTINKRTGEQTFFKIDPKSKKLNIIREKNSIRTNLAQVDERHQSEASDEEETL